jgi:SNF2 family DNA or RNA helicase
VKEKVALFAGECPNFLLVVPRPQRHNRQSLDTTSIHRISVSDSQIKPVTVNDLLNPPRSTLRYRTIDSDILEEIRSRDSLGKFGSKIQTLIKHLLYLKDSQPGSKSICFSAWSDSLGMVSYALETNGITYLRIDGPNKKTNPVREFQTNPRYQVLLLHG